MLVKTEESVKLSTPIQELITRREQLSCARVTAFHGPVYFKNGFGAKFRYL